MDHYIPDHTYHRLVAALRDLKPCPVTGTVESYQLHEALGCVGGIWPASISEADSALSAPVAA